MLLNDRYEKVKKLGEGSYGIVYKYIDHKPKPKKPEAPKAAEGKTTEEVKGADVLQPVLPSGPPPVPTFQVPSAVEDAKLGEKKQYVAIKKLKQGKADEGAFFSNVREIKLLQEFNHPNIIKLIDTFYAEPSLYVVLEYMPTDLKKLIVSRVPLSDSHIKGIMKQILEGVKYLHSHYVVHRDVTPGNMLVSPEGNIKFSDFGLARLICLPGSQMTRNVCTLYGWYRAPEILFGAAMYGPAIDIWAVGCIFAELLLRAPLFNGQSEMDQLTKIFTLRGVPDEENWPGVSLLGNYIPFAKQPAVPLEDIFPGRSLETIELLEWMLQLNPNKRCTAEQALEHKYFTTYPPPCHPSEIPIPREGTPKNMI